MDAYLQTIQEVPLFDGIKTGELPTILQCLQAKTVQYEKDDYICLRGVTRNMSAYSVRTHTGCKG